MANAAISVSFAVFAGGNPTKAIDVSAVNLAAFVKPRQLTFRSNSGSFGKTRQSTLQRKGRSPLRVHAKYNDSSNGGGADFVTGFLLGGAVVGTLAYIFAPQIRRSLLNEDEYGFRKARRPSYCDEGLELTRQTLNEKISQLNSAIDNISSRLLRGGNNFPPIPVDTDAEEAAL